jgi:drug/metabolite transporter (DMT)-like permease
MGSGRIGRMWFVLALVAALCQVLRNTVMKRLGHSLDEYINVWGRFTFLLPFAALFVAWRGVPSIQPGFVGACVLFAVSQIISTLALSKGLKLAPISLVTPLWKVSLLVLLGLAYVTLREKPSALGVAGVLLSMIGVYLLNVRRARIAWYAPLAVLLTDAGLRWTLVSAVFFAPSVVTIKRAMQLSDPYMGTLGGYLAASALITPLVLLTSRPRFGQVGRYWKEFVGLGFFAALTTVSQGIAYLLTLSSYVEAVKQVEILFAMGIGVVVFGERQQVREIAPGALVMLAGMVLLGLAGAR